MTWRRFIFNTIKEAATSSNRTANARTRQLTGEVSLLFGITAGSVSFLWYFIGVPIVATKDGLTRNTLTKCWGSNNMYLTTKVLFQSETHKIYSLLHKSGDCMIYAVHFPSGKVWSTRLENTNNASTMTQTLHQDKEILEAISESEDNSYWRDDGVFNALERWANVFTGKIAYIRNRNQMIAGTADDYNVTFGTSEKALKIMIPFMVTSAMGLLSFPFRYWFITSDRDVNNHLPKPIEGNVTYDRWTKLLEQYCPGIPLSDRSTIKYDDKEMKIIIMEEKLNDKGTAYRPLHIKLTGDPWAAARIEKYSDMYIRAGVCSNILAGVYIFSRLWMWECLKPHDYLAKELIQIHEDSVGQCQSPHHLDYFH